MLGIGISNIIVGKLMSSGKYNGVLTFFTIMAGLSTFISILLCFLEKGKLNESASERKERERLNPDPLLSPGTQTFNLLSPSAAVAGLRTK